MHSLKHLIQIVNNMRRALQLKLEDGRVIELEITKAVAVQSPKKMFNLEELPDGSHRLIWSKSLCENFSEIKEINIIRED